MTLKFQVPLPPRELSSNGSHGHWSKVSKARKQYRNEVFVETLAAQTYPRTYLEKARISLVFCTKGGRKVKRYQPLDAANALSAFKAGIDGMVDSHMVPDDSAKHLELGAILIDVTRGPFVEVTVEPLPEIHRVLGGTK